MKFSRIKLHANRALEAQNPMTHRSSWRMGALASAIALLGSLSIHSAHALGLGRITVQSALGEALKAEIEVPEITAEEASSLRVGVAAPAAFKAAGLEYTTALTGLQINLQKRSDGRSYLSLTSARPVTEPFVDLILEASWASGRVVRDYTMLFDPPNLRQAAPGAPTAPILSRPSTAPSSGSPSLSAMPPAASSAQVTPRAAAIKAAPPAPAPKAARPAAAAKPAASGQQVTVKAGDTASKIAAQNKPASVSLDQMLVALLKSNPEAFIGGNINRLKSGAVLDVPSADDANALSPGDASRTVIAQSKDFNDFRQKLAASVPGAQVAGANRLAGGKVQAKVEDRAATAATPDKLTLSKGALQGKAVAEDKIAKDKQTKDASTRVAELSKNIGDLNKIAGPTAAAPAAAAVKAPGLTVPAAPALSVPAAATPPSAAASAAAAPASAVSSPKVTATVAATPTPSVVATSSSATMTTAAPVAASTAASAPVLATSAPSTVASAPVVVKRPVAVAPPPPPEPSLIDQLTDNPLVVPGLGVLLAGLAGFGYYRFKKRNNPTPVDSSFLESRLQPDSFFGASGGQRIDTSEGASASGSSMVYSPSQLDAAGDVDPVAEADVYLAYGRDLQAEEILKEALRTNPSRVAIHAKLTEIYAKRRDLKAFDSIASEAYALTNGNGQEWAYICEMGRDLDPTNPVYQPGGEPQRSDHRAAGVALSTAEAFSADTTPQMLAAAPSAASAEVDFDLDLDFSAADAPTVAMPRAPTYTPEPAVATRAAAIEPTFAGLDMDFNTDMPAIEVPHAPRAASAMPALGKAAAIAAAPAALDSGMLEFDMNSLSLDLDAPATASPTLAKAAPAPAAAAPQGPLETKFALAEEFRALGDSDGARSLASEVVAQAQGSLKTKAQAFLNALS